MGVPRNRHNPALPCPHVVSWVPQIVVPPLVAPAFLRSLDRKWVLALAPTIFLADIDYAFPGEHRVYTHNLVLPALLMAVVWLLWRRHRTALRDMPPTPAWPGEPTAPVPGALRFW